MKKAGFLKRATAVLIDSFLFWFVAEVLAGFGHGNIFLLWIIFETALVSQLDGFTIGKRAIGIRVVSINGNHINFSEALIRSVGKIVSTIVFLLGDLWMLKDKNSQTWHDKLSGTMVVES